MAAALIALASLPAQLEMGAFQHDEIYFLRKTLAAMIFLIFYFASTMLASGDFPAASDKFPKEANMRQWPPPFSLSAR